MDNRKLWDSCREKPKGDWKEFDPEQRRPGIRAIVKRLQQANPQWSLERCIAKAKTLWNEEHSKC